MMRRVPSEGGKDIRRILQNATGPHAGYCEGFGNHDSKGCYVTTPVIAAGEATVKSSHGRSLVLEQIQAFDTAEAEGAYIGQINLIAVSSFCGLNGVIWGHDIMKSEKVLLKPPRSAEVGTEVPIYDIGSLLLASKRLYGGAKHRKFPIIPGSIVPAAYKTISEVGPVTLFGGLAIGIPKDEARSAALFMEFVGSVPGLVTGPGAELELSDIMDNLVASTIEVGTNHDIGFKMIYVGARSRSVDKGRIGCVLVAVPYVTLATRAVNERLLNNLEDAGIEDWEAETGLRE